MDFRGLACLMGATVLVSACTTDVTGNNNFTTTAGSSSTTSASGEGPTTASSTSEGTSSSSTSEGTTEVAESSSSSESSSTGGGFGSLCGNGTIEGQEDCDCGDDGECTEDELGGIACESTSDPLVPGILTGGPLGCNPASCRYDTSQCVYCGDGELNGNETCELDAPIETSCSELGKGTAGKLLCMDTCQVDTAACTECGFTFDFEGDQCPGDWETLKTTNPAADASWECGTPSSFAGGPGASKTGVWGTNLSGNYQSNESGYVRSGNLDLSNCGDKTVTLTIRHWFDFQGGGLSNADGGIVQVTNGNPELIVDGWVTIEPTGDGALYIPNVAASYPPVDGNPAFSGLDVENEGMWVESTFDVTEYAGPELHIRFLIGSNDNTERAGWYIDNVEIIGSGGA